jgi:hypothetical protein
MMSKRNIEFTMPADEAPERETPSEIGEDLEGEAGNTSQDNMTPHGFGTFAHSAYETHVDLRFDDVENELPVRVTKPDGSVKQGWVDTAINDDQVLIDYKTGDMREWDVQKARKEAQKHGQQVREYMDSPDTPEDASGWIVATVPPVAAETRQAYSDALAEHKVGVKFSESEEPEDVMAAVQSAADDSATHDETVKDSSLDHIGEDLES